MEVEGNYRERPVRNAMTVAVTVRFADAGKACLEPGQRLLAGIVTIDRVLEFELYGVLQEFHETAFLFGSRSLDGLALVAAQRTKEERKTAFAPKDVHTLAAHDFTAVSAFVSGGGSRMPRTNHPAIGLHDRGLGTRALKLRNCNVGLGGFHEHFHIAQRHGLARQQARFGYRITIDESAVCGLAIPQQEAIGGENEFAMNCRNGGVINREIAVRRASDSVYARAQL